MTDSGCANCGEEFVAMPKGYNRYSLHRKLPKRTIKAHKALEKLCGVDFTPVSSKHKGPFLCQRCWVDLAHSYAFKDSASAFWRSTNKGGYIGAKVSIEASINCVDMAPVANNSYQHSSDDHMPEKNVQLITTVDTETTGFLDVPETLPTSPYPVDLVTNQINSGENCVHRDDLMSPSVRKRNFGTKMNGSGQHGVGSPKDGGNKTCTVSSSSIETNAFNETQYFKTECSTERTTSFNLQVSKTAQGQSCNNIPKKESAVVSTENVLYAIRHDHLSYAKSDMLKIFPKDYIASETPTTPWQTADTCSSNSVFQNDLPLQPAPRPVSLIKNQLHNKEILSLDSYHDGCPASAGNIHHGASRVRKSKRVHMGESNIKPKKWLLRKCHLCLIKFSKRSILFTHIRKIHMATRPVMCSVCKMEIKTPASFHHHQLLHLGLRPFPCKSCPKTYIDVGSLNSHQKRVHTHNKKVDKRKKKVDKQKISAKNIVCRVCNVFFMSPQDRREHSSVHTGKTRYVCKKCPKAFKEENKLKNHEESHTEKTPFVCEICKREFVSKENLAAHKPFHIGKKGFMCGVCGRSVSKMISILTHRRIHTGEKPYSCHVCGKTFHSCSNRSSHERVHSEGLHVCGICCKAFKTRSALKRHQLYHSGEKAHVCELCGKSFFIKDDLERHRRLHSGDKPFKCTVCDKAYVCKRALNWHVREMHNGDCVQGPSIRQQRICYICGKLLHTRSGFTYHMKVHSGVKDHLCSVCGKAFYSLVGLRTHEVMHTSKTAYLCETCGRRCRSKESLKKHDELKHREPRC